MSLALLTERTKRFEDFPKPDLPSLDADPAEVAAAYARGFAKFVLKLRSADALDRVAFARAVDGAIEDNNRTALIELRLACLEYGTSAYKNISISRRVIQDMHRLFEQRAARISDPGKRRYFRTKIAESINAHEKAVGIDEAFISFLQQEIQPKIDSKIREQARAIADDPTAIREDLNRRYPRVTAYLAR
ncbi:MULTISPECIES: hypothetical protein [Rhizobium]|uniref:hypothetical protein n=1 Tax=Rhizobium TaxID=379 RepID=UPI001A9286F7|nr:MULTISPECIES: hypothetical protein [Rhizobium]MBX5063460.1 hypothetical protein [Rhizobium lentis]MBX5075566.1 hypothetical protein [Rhizobium lentis]MBX5213044.1 hypothetical protein [Rhizobium sp. NLR9a]QSW93211.1 hypothetical protein J0663_19425 [Rhizobium lentis]